MKIFLTIIFIGFNCYASIPQGNGQGTMGGSVGTLLIDSEINNSSVGNL